MLGTVWAFPGVSHVISPAVGQITDSEGKEESWMREGQSSSGQLSGHSPLPGRKGGPGRGLGRQVCRRVVSGEGWAHGPRVSPVSPSVQGP